MTGFTSKLMNIDICSDKMLVEVIFTITNKDLNNRSKIIYFQIINDDEKIFVGPFDFPDSYEIISVTPIWMN